MARDYRKIRAWQLADDLAIAIYRATTGFPKSETFGLTSQMRRAAVSAAANIVEGATRRHSKEYMQFLHTSMGSLAELGYYIGFSERIGYLDNGLAKDLLSLHEHTARTTHALMNYIEQSQSG